MSLLQAGLLAALEELAERVRKRGSLDCRVEEDSWPEQLEPSLATHLYRAFAQEALQQRHRPRSGDPRSIIRLSADDHLLTLTITNDGVGLSEGAAQGPGMGLRIMRYRADLIGADLQIGRGPGKGIAVTCSCPRPDTAKGAGEPSDERSV